MKVGLGTAQFGLNYGISNLKGKVQDEEIRVILDLAGQSGVKTIDTAYQYGTSEETLGRLLPTKEPVQLVTKTASLKSATGDALAHIRSRFEQSLLRLRRTNVYALLVHNASDLLSQEGDRLWSLLMTLKKDKVVERIGVSIYRPEDIDQVMGRYSIDIVQAPVNIFDQRLIVGGQLSQLKKKNIEVHSRSTFLQGLLLMPLEQVQAYFKPWLPLIVRYHNYVTELKKTPLQVALQFVIQQPMIDRVIVGACSSSEFRDILSAAQSDQNVLDLTSFAIEDEGLINPSLWKVA